MGDANKPSEKKKKHISLKAYLLHELNFDGTTEENASKTDYRTTTYNLLTIPVRLEKVFSWISLAN